MRLGTSACFSQGGQVSGDAGRVDLAGGSPLGSALAGQGRIADAKAAFSEATRLQPDRPSWRFRHLGYLPLVFSDRSSIDEHFAALDQQLDEASREGFGFDWRQCLHDGFCPPFGLTHQGRCCRELKEKYASLFARHFPHARPLSRETDRPRIGFLVTAGRERGFLRNMEHIIPKLDRERFEAVVVCPENGLKLCQGTIRAEHVGWAPYPHEFVKSVEAITAARCDILYHRQIGTAVTNYFFPFARCAPIQCTGWGGHGTTGIEAVDYYLSSDLVEIDEAEPHYTERLFRFRNTFPTCQSRIKTPQPARREDFGLPDRRAIYFCPQRIEKIHPDFDRLLRGILEADGNGTILMLKGRYPLAFEQLIARFRRTLGPKLLKRMAFAGRLSTHRYYRLLSLADAILDAPNYSTSLTGFDAISLGIPIVTLPGTRNVERYAQGLYRKMGVIDLIVESEEQYISAAARLGNDAGFRRHMHEKIQRHGDVLFENIDAVKEHERFFEYAWRRRDRLE